MKLETRPLSEHVGVEILRFDPEAPAESMRAALEPIFIESGVMLFRGLGPRPDVHLAISRCFGDLERHPVKEVWVDGCPELIDLAYRPSPAGPPTAPVYEVEGRVRAGWLPWHADLFYMDRINRGGILRAVEIPAEGGSTGFIDRIRLYESLPQRLKQRIENLSVIYKFDPGMVEQKFGQPARAKLVASSPILDALTARLESDFPPVVHPMVYTQAETGRKVLNVSPLHATGILGMENAEGDALLAEIVDHIERPMHAYHHEWQQDDLVLWDNWRTLHCAEGVPVDCARLMQRTTIAGDYGRGRQLPH
ncbi:MAG TPA: TauD/TfdA family dioxygenase [Alphaproteobacteria bacterium]|nr:TauD/TfdA family dioxygenase [Alphaproteobacteria bacterium]